jgi:hypothetical protein
VGRPEVSISDVQWVVVVDEAVILFGAHIPSPGAFLMYGIDPDFIDQTLLLLSAVATTRGKLVPAFGRAKPGCLFCVLTFTPCLSNT